MLEVLKMKKILLIPAIAVVMCGCNEEVTRPDSLSIIAPTGAPAVAFYNYSEDSHFVTNSEPSNIVPLMLKGEKDVVVLPTNVGINAINNKKAPYKIAATITFGNVYVAKTGHDDDGVMDKDDYIVLFQQNSIPDLLFHSIYGDALNEGIHYVDTVSYAAQCLKTGKDVTRKNEAVDYVLIAEPAFTKVMGDKRESSFYVDIQKEYGIRYTTGIFQASVFVNNNSDPKLIEDFLSCLKDDVKKGIANPGLIKDGLAKNEKPGTFYGVEPELAEKVTKDGNGMGLGFEYAKDKKEAIDNYLKIFNINETSEEIYFK